MGLRANLFVVGAAKSGTTSLHAFLSRHPDICMSDPKEPLFFEAEWERGAEWYHQRYFSHWRGEGVVGESRHRNMVLPWTLSRIRRYTGGECLVVALLREPMARAYSHYWHLFSRGYEVRPFATALAHELERLEGGWRWRKGMDGLYRSLLRGDGDSHITTYVESGLYGEQLGRLIDVFGPESVLVDTLDRFGEDPRPLLEAVCRRFELSPGPFHDAQTWRAANAAAPRGAVRALERLRSSGLTGVVPRSVRRLGRRLVERLPRRAGGPEALDRADPVVQRAAELFRRDLPVLRDQLGRLGDPDIGGAAWLEP